MSSEIKYVKYKSLRIVSIHFRTQDCQSLINFCSLFDLQVRRLSQNPDKSVVYMEEESWEDFKNTIAILGYTEFVEKATVQECYE